MCIRDSVAVPVITPPTFTSPLKVAPTPTTLPVRSPATLPVIPPIKLDAATAAAVKIPTIIFGVPLKLNAVDAVPVRSPVNPLVAVTNPA